MTERPSSLLVCNARGCTPEVELPFPTAIGIVGERIVAVGERRGVRAALPRGAEEVDAEGGYVVPGFMDNHVHLLMAGAYLLGLDLRGAKGPEEFGAKLRERAKEAAKGEWITGGRWDNSSWPGGPWPHRDLIDGFTADVPVFVTRTDGHVGLANGCALRLAGITPETPSPPGGAIDRDEGGRLTGILRDAAMGLVQRHIPEPGEEQRERMARAALRRAASCGVTSLNDFQSGGALPIYQRLLEGEELTCRIRVWFGLGEWEHLAALGLPRGFGGEMLKIGGAKGFVDGSLGARTAWMFEPFLDEPESCGLAMEAYADGTLERQMLAADRAGLALAVHAIGDRANAALLDIIEKMERVNGRRDRRVRVEHAQHLREEDLARFARLGAVASVQPGHILLDAAQAERALGPERAARTYAFRSLLAAGARVTFGTDWPVVPLDPLETIYAAVTRRPRDGSFPGGWHAAQSVSVREAIYCYTAANAFAEFEEGRKGCIAPGRLGDVAVLSEDPAAVAPERIGEVRVRMTVVGGRVVYRAGER